MSKETLQGGGWCGESASQAQTVFNKKVSRFSSSSFDQKGTKKKVHFLEAPVLVIPPQRVPDTVAVVWVHRWNLLSGIEETPLPLQVD